MCRNYKKLKVKDNYIFVMFPALFTAEEFFWTSKKLQRINAAVQTCIETHEVTKNCVLNFDLF